MVWHQDCFIKERQKMSPSVLCEMAEEEANVQIHEKVLWDFREVNVWM